MREAGSNRRIDASEIASVALYALLSILVAFFDRLYRLLTSAGNYHSEYQIYPKLHPSSGRSDRSIARVLHRPFACKFADF